MMHEIPVRVTPARMDSGRYVLFVMPLLIAVAMVAFGQIVAGDATWASFGYQDHLVPSALAVASDVHAGQWPFWWQGLGLGVPLMERAAQGALYPFTWLAVSARAYDVIVVGHLVYFALGTALWSRERGANDLTSALWGAATLIAVPWLWLAHSGSLFSWAHVPWLCLVGARFARPSAGQAGSAAAAAVLWAAVGVAGSSLFFGGFAVLWLAYGAVAWRKRFVWAAAAVVVGALIAAPQWWPMVAGALQTTTPMAALAGPVVSWPEGLGRWAEHLLVVAPALAFAPTLVRREPSLLIIIGGAVAAAVITHSLVGNVADVALWLGLGAWLAATSTAFTFEQMGTHRVMRVEVPLAALALAGLAGMGHAPSHAIVACGVLLAIAVSAWLWLGRHLRWLGTGVVAATFVLGFAAAGTTALIPRAALRLAPALWPTGLASSNQPARVLRANQLFDDELPIDASIRRAYNTLHGAMAASDGAANVTAGAAFDPRLADAIAHAAGSMGQFIDRLGIPYAIAPASTVVPSGLERLATYDRWSLVRTHTARPRAFVTSDVGHSRADAVWREIFPVGLARHAISYVSLDEAMLTASDRRAVEAMEGDAIGACDVTTDTPSLVALRCRHDGAGVAVLLDAWAPGWQATVNGVARDTWLADGVARAVRVDAGQSAIVWRYQPVGWRAATYLWWAGMLGWLGLLAWWAVNRFDHRRATMSP